MKKWLYFLGIMVIVSSMNASSFTEINCDEIREKIKDPEWIRKFEACKKGTGNVFECMNMQFAVQTCASDWLEQTRSQPTK